MLELAGKRVVVTGATGFIGRNVTRMLLHEHARVYAIVRPESKQKHFLAESVRDERDENLCILSAGLKEMHKALLAAGVSHADIFLHFAWRGVNREEIDSTEVQGRNIDMSLHCLDAAHALGCSLFMDAGSRVEYGAAKDGRMEESMDCHPINAYGRAKLAFYERAARRCGEWGLTFCHLRFFSVYGIGDHPWSIISTLTRELPQGKKVSLSACMHRWNFMDIEDAGRAVLELCRYSDSFAGETHIVNIASADTRRLRDYVEEIHALCAGRGELEFGTFVQAKEGPLSICPAIEELTRLTKGTWRERVPFREGIKRILDFSQ